MDFVDKISLKTIRKWFFMSALIGGAIFVGLIVFGIDGLNIGQQTFLNKVLFYFASFIIASLLLFFISEMILVIGFGDLWKASKPQTHTNQERLEAFYEISQKLILVSEESDVIDFVLNKSIQLSEAIGASYVPLDAFGQPLAAISLGKRPEQLMDEYLEYLATPAVRNRCQTCVKHHTLSDSCHLLDQPATTANGIYCLPIRRGSAEYGLLNLFLPEDVGLSDEAQEYLQAMADQTAIAIEAVRLRKKELDALSSLQGEWKKTDRKALLNDLLAHIHGAMSADFSLLQFNIDPKTTPSIQIKIGEQPKSSTAFIQSVIDGVIQSGNSMVLGEVQDVNQLSDVPFSMIVTPLGGDKNPDAGIILVGSYSKRKYSARQRNLLATIAGQVSLVLENYQLISELESKTLLEERSRLAREIHDGLAQNLGFLKLQIAQIKKKYDEKEYQRMQELIDLSYNAVSEAYQDVREAIDGLRIDLHEGNFVFWVEQVVKEFVEMNDIKVQISVSPDLPELPSEVQVQLIRVLQESLSNIRKHSQATQVDIRCIADHHKFQLEISDNGIGFSPDEVYGLSRHGLVGMKERSTLIGADIDIESTPESGTTVKIKLPLGVLEVA